MQCWPKDTLFTRPRSISFASRTFEFTLDLPTPTTPPHPTRNHGLHHYRQPVRKDGVEDQLRAKLAEAAQTYSKDAGVLGWYPMQNVSDSRKWTIVERYDQESTVAKHREHPDYKTFAGALLPLLENGQESLDVHQFNEL
ncbi:Dimeric alpha-beta barrel [Phytophthora cactorum]|nr:Dimeric alpha-beta barrel [Phytophthora cactorum]